MKYIINARTTHICIGMTYFVYRYHDDLSIDGWMTGAIPALCGWVDCRRFCVFTIFGGASTAIDNSMSLIDTSNDGCTNGSVIDITAVKPTISTDVLYGITRHSNDVLIDCFCSKRKMILLTPKVLFLLLGKILRGEYASNEMINIELIV